MHTVKATTHLNLCTLLRIQNGSVFSPRKVTLFMKKNHSRKFHPFLTRENLTHRQTKTVYHKQPVSDKHTQRLTILSSTISDIEPRRLICWGKTAIIFLIYGGIYNTTYYEA